MDKNNYSKNRYANDEEFREKIKSYMAMKNYERYKQDNEYREQKKEKMRLYHRSLVEAKQKLEQLNKLIQV